MDSCTTVRRCPSLAVREWYVGTVLEEYNPLQLARRVERDLPASSNRCVIKSELPGFGSILGCDLHSSLVQEFRMCMMKVYAFFGPIGLVDAIEDFDSSVPLLNEISVVEWNTLWNIVAVIPTL